MVNTNDPYANVSKVHAEFCKLMDGLRESAERMVERLRIRGKPSRWAAKFEHLSIDGRGPLLYMEPGAISGVGPLHRKVVEAFHLAIDVLESLHALQSTGGHLDQEALEEIEGSRHELEILCGVLGDLESRNVRGMPEEYAEAHPHIFVFPQELDRIEALAVRVAPPPELARLLPGRFAAPTSDDDGGPKMEPIARLCEEFGISSSTAHDWANDDPNSKKECGGRPRVCLVDRDWFKRCAEKHWADFGGRPTR